MVLKSNGKTLAQLRDFQLSELIYPLENHQLYKYHLNEPLSFDTLLPYQAFNRTIFFSCADELYNIYKEHNNAPIKVTVEFYTATKKLLFKTIAFELTDENIKNFIKMKGDDFCILNT